MSTPNNPTQNDRPPVPQPGKVTNDRADADAMAQTGPGLPDEALGEGEEGFASPLTGDEGAILEERVRRQLGVQGEEDTP